MKLIVQKFGGSSVRDAQRIRNVAGIIADTYRAGNQVLVVLSAQGDTTDDLIEKAREINPRASKREMDMLLSTGEQISIALCAMALEGMGLPVVSLTGCLFSCCGFLSCRLCRIGFCNGNLLSVNNLSAVSAAILPGTGLGAILSPGAILS